jgi:MFS family permease
MVTLMQEGTLIGGSIGVVLGVIFSDAIGRRTTILSSMVMALAGILISLTVPVIELRIVGLLMWGAGSDISFAVAASSITEIVAE